MAHNDIDRVQVVREMFSTNGPHTPESMIAAAEAIAELWRYLGHATISGTREILTDPADAYTLTGALAAADRSSVDVLERLALYARNIGDESTYTKHFGITDPDGSYDQIQSLMNRVTSHLREAASNQGAAAGWLDRAHSQLSFVYRDQEDD